MNEESSEALARLKELIDSPSMGALLDDACAERTVDGRVVLTVRGDFPKRLLETRYASELERAFQVPVDVIAARREAPDEAGAARVRPQLHGRGGEYAVRVVKAFVEGGPLCNPLVVIHGPPRSGKSALVEWACMLARRRVFRLDLDRLRAGHSRGLVPRKPLVIADGVHTLACRSAGQRNLIRILDTLRDRGDRALLTIEGHPRSIEGLTEALVNRCEGGVLIGLEEPGLAAKRLQLRDHARRKGRTLPRAWEEELIRMPAHDGIAALDARLRGEIPGGGGERDAIERMKDVASRLLEVDRSWLDSESRRRSAVEARRVVITAALRGGVDPVRIAAVFRLKSVRSVREARRRIEVEEQRDPRFARLVDEVRRVLPAP
jgi:chromosomal replication initiation ATPase DnaA